MCGRQSSKLERGMNRDHVVGCDFNDLYCPLHKDGAVGIICKDI